MSTDHISKFISDVAVQFTPPKYDTPHERDAWLRSMVTALRGSSPDVLERAARIIIETRKNRYFPLIAECRQALREAADELRFDQRAGTLPEFRSAGDEWSTERCRLAHDLKRADLGKQAAREGWIVAFWHFCRRNRRVPAGREIDQCKQDSDGIEEIYDRAMRGECGPASEMIAKLGASILEKRNRWSEEAMGR